MVIIFPLMVHIWDRPDSCGGLLSLLLRCDSKLCIFGLWGKTTQQPCVLWETILGIFYILINTHGHDWEFRRADKEICCGRPSSSINHVCTTVVVTEVFLQ